MLNYHRVPCRAANSAASLSSVSGWGAIYEAESIGSPLKMSAVEVAGPVLAARASWALIHGIPPFLWTK